MGVHVFPILNPPPHSIPLGHPSAPAPSTLNHASNLDCRFISHVIIYMFQCHSPISSHPRPLQQSPKDCSFYTSMSLLLSRIQGYHYHLSKFHIYAVLVFFFLAYFTLYNTRQLSPATPACSPELLRPGKGTKCRPNQVCAFVEYPRT